MQKKKTKNVNRTIKVTLFVALAICLSIVFVRPALADPHAMFFTDRGQEQVFYNFLAALNQADYVEAPPVPSIDPNVAPVPATTYAPTSPPNIDYNTRIGNYLASGTYYPRTDQRTATVNGDGSISIGTNGTATPLEPQERTNLPHITVRQVTSDNGDAFLRESLQRRALAEQMRVEFSGLSCRILEGIYGPQAVRDPNDNSQTNSSTSPCDKFLEGDNLIFAR